MEKEEKATYIDTEELKKLGYKYDNKSTYVKEVKNVFGKVLKIIQVKEKNVVVSRYLKINSCSVVHKEDFDLLNNAFVELSEDYKKCKCKETVKLTATEKNYLNVIIAPHKEMVNHIVKIESNGKLYLKIAFNASNGASYILITKGFEKMKMGKPYKLKDLQL